MLNGHTKVDVGDRCRLQIGSEPLDVAWLQDCQCQPPNAGVHTKYKLTGSTYSCTLMTEP